MSKDLPGHARYRHANEGCTSRLDESAELGWNHEYITLVPLPGRVFFAFFCLRAKESNRYQSILNGQRLHLQEE